MKFRALLLDFGGVLSPNGLPGEGLDRLLQNLDVEPALEHYEQLRLLLDRLKINELTNRKFWQEFAEHHKKQIPSDIESVWKTDFPMHKKLLSYLKKVKAQGLTIAILSNVNAPVRQHLIDLGAYEGYDHLFLSDELGMAKPDPRIFEHALQKMGVDSQETVFVDDQARNIEAAEKLGMTVILAVNEEQIIRELKSLLE